MYIFKFILNSKEPEVSRWDEVKIFLNLMERPDQCPGIQETTKARRQRKQLILVFTCINTSKSSTLYMRRVYSTESQSYITIKVLTKLVICRYFFFHEVSITIWLNIYRWQWSYPYMGHHFSLPCPYSNICAADLIIG